MNGAPVTETLQINMWFDYTCPHSHSGLALTKDLSQQLGCVINYLPYLLRPFAPIPDFGPSNPSNITQIPMGQPLKSGTETLVEPFSNRTLSTVLVHEATAFATTQMRFFEFYEAISREYWDYGADIGSLYLIRKATLQAGLSWESMWETLSRSSFRNWVLEQHEQAIIQGVKTIPAYLIGSNLWQGTLTRFDLESAIKQAL